MAFVVAVVCFAGGGVWVCVCLGGGRVAFGGGLFVLMQLFNKKFNAAVKVINSTLVSSIVQLLSAGDPQNQQGC